MSQSTLLEKDPGNKEIIIGFHEPCRIIKTYSNWNHDEIQREKKLLNIPSNFIWHPLSVSDDPDGIEIYAPFCLTLNNFLHKLRKFILQPGNDQIDENKYRQYQYSWILQGSNALYDIHANKMYHGRLSDESFYVDEYLKIKIGNIGYSLDDYTNKIHKYYMPKEGFDSKFKICETNGQQYDIYSFGVLMAEILSLKPYYIDEQLDNNDYKKFKKLFKNTLEELEKKEPKFANIILQCTDEDPNKRIKSETLFKEIKSILEEQKQQFAINSLQVTNPPLNVFEAMKIIPPIFPIEIQIINNLKGKCAYNDVYQIILTHPKLISLFDFSIGSPLITYSFNQINFKINYEKYNFITVSTNEYLKDYTFNCLLTMTLQDLLSDYNFIPNDTDIISWFYTIQYYILDLISRQVPVCKLSLNSIFVKFGVDQVQLFLFPIGESADSEVHFLIGWLYQLGSLMNEIILDYQKKMRNLNLINQNDENVQDIAEIYDINDIESIQSLISACLSIKDPNMITKIMSLLINVYEKNKETIESNKKNENLDVFSIFNRLKYLESLPSDDRFKECTKDEFNILQNLLYSFLDYFLPEECKSQDKDELILPFNILRAFYDILYNYEHRPIASEVIAQTDKLITEMKQLNPIRHDFDLTGLQTNLFRQFMLIQVPRIMINDNNHIFVITVNDNDDSDPNSDKLLTLQKVIDFAEESKIKYEKIDDNTVSLYYYAC